MSKFKKNKFSLEDLLEERLEEYEASIEDECDTHASNRKEDSSIVQHDKGFYDSLMKLYVKDLESLTKNLHYHQSVVRFDFHERLQKSQ